MFIRTMTLATALFCGFLAAQAPEFAQQYRQRLGGTVDELGRVVADFDRDAQNAGLDRQRAVTFMMGAQDNFVHLRGVTIEATIARYERLRAQLAAFERSGPLGKVESVMTTPDRALVSATLSDYEPALPTTPAGAITAGAGFLLVYLLYAALRLIALPFRHSRRKALRTETRPL